MDCKFFNDLPNNINSLWVNNSSSYKKSWKNIADTVTDRRSLLNQVTM